MYKSPGHWIFQCPGIVAGDADMNFFRSVGILIVVSGLLFPVSGLAESKPEPVPILYIEKTDYSAGKVIEGQVIRHTFLVQNRGTAPLEIRRVETDCSCTRTHFDSLVAPGMNTYLRVVFKTAGQAGDREKTLVIHSNDPVQGRKTLKIRTQILKAVIVSPDRVSFKGEPGKVQTKEIMIHAPDNKPFNLTFKESRLPDDVGVAYEKKGNAWQIYIRCKGEKSGTSRGRVFFTTDIPYRPLVTIPVYVRLQDSLSPVPGSLNFGKIRLSSYTGKATPLPERSVNIRTSGQSFKIENLRFIEERTWPEPAARLFKIKQENLPNVLRITLCPDIRRFKPGNYTSRLVIQLATPEKKQIMVPVSIEIQ